MTQGETWLLISMVVLISYAVYATDECAGGVKKPVQCYECNSQLAGQWYCEDPFNTSHPDLETQECTGACAKWIKKPKNGPMTYIRTCSSNLDLRMPFSHVCMLESRPGDGKLCFCGKSQCNHGNSLHSIQSHWAALFITLLTFLLINHKWLSFRPVLPVLWSNTLNREYCGLTNNNLVLQYVGFLQRHRDNDIKDINTG